MKEEEEEEEEGDKVLVNSGKFNLYLCIVFRLSGPGVLFKYNLFAS